MPHTSELPSAAAPLHWFTEAGVAVDGPLEWKPMLLELVVPTSEWESATIQVGNHQLPVALRRIGNTTCVIAEWPRYGPGYYQVQLRWKDGAWAGRFRIDPAKLAEGEFERLLDDLERQLPVSIAIALQQLGGIACVDIGALRPPTIAEEIQRMRAAIIGDRDTPGLVRLLTEIAREPYVQLRNTSHWVHRRDARRPLSSALRQAFVRAGNLDEERRPIKVADSRVLQSVDVYENRLLATFARQVDLRLRRLRSALPSGESQLGEEAATLAVALQRARHAAAFLDEVSVLREPPSQVTMVLLRRPWYKDLYRAYRAFHRGLPISLDSSGLDAPLNNLPYLYQMWGTLQVIRELLEAALELGYTLESERLIGHDPSGWYMRALPNDVAAVVLVHARTGRRVRLIPERSYPERGRTAEGLSSLTFTQRPDIAIEVMENARVVNVVLLDPKYKLDGEIDVISRTSPLKNDIDKMHAYRDAVRASDGRRVVSFACILYPGASSSFGSEIAAFGARPDITEQLRNDLRTVLQPIL